MRCAEVVPHGTFSCGFATIHLVAPYDIHLIDRKAFKSIDTVYLM